MRLLRRRAAPTGHMISSAPETTRFLNVILMSPG
jgi:hypothetical protein